MLTLQQAMLERNTCIRKWIESCLDNGTSRRKRDTVERFLKSYNISREEFEKELQDEWSIRMISNATHYILSFSEFIGDF